MEEVKERDPKGRFIKGHSGYKPFLNHHHTFQFRKQLSDLRKKDWREGKYSNDFKKGISLTEGQKRKLSESAISYWDKKGRVERRSWDHMTGDPRYRKWRKSVFERDNYTCQDCKSRSSKSCPVYLEAHHIKSWSEFPKLRYETENGLTLCSSCHKRLTFMSKQWKKKSEIWKKPKTK